MSLGVQTGDRIGVLGLNGSGKTTLLTLLAGLVPPDSGRVATLRGVTIEVVTQADQLEPGATVRDIVLHTFGDGDHGWASDSSVRAILDGLGLANIGLDTLVDNLSGGERRRVALAAALVTDADLLILDEPTNHLDIEGVAWLAEHLLARRSALVAVTHDRWFLDAVATTTWEVVDGGVHIREGGYSDWVFARAERLRLDRAAEETRKNLARKELAWLRRGAPARTSKPRYRIEAAEALIADVPEPRNTVELHSFARKRLGKDVLDLENVTATVPTQDGERVLLDDVTWRIGPGDRIGLVGINGSGKSTLLRVLVGDRALTSGLVKTGKTVNVGYLSQDVVELPAQLRLLEAVTEIAGTVNLGGKDISAGQLAERFGFTNEHQWTRVAQLSGGERRRLQLLRILMARAERADPRRADQRPGHRHARRAGGSARLLAGHLDRGQPRPVPDRAGHRRRGRPAGRRQGDAPAWRDCRIPAAAGCGRGGVRVSGSGVNGLGGGGGGEHLVRRARCRRDQKPAQGPAALGEEAGVLAAQGE